MTDGNDYPVPPPPPPPLGTPPSLAAPPLGDVASQPSADEPHTDAAEPRARAVQHVTESTKTYPCEACGGDLTFNIAKQKLACQHCGAEFAIAQAAVGVGERDLREALEMMRSSAATRANTLVSGEKEIVCQNCGGHSTFSGSLTSQKCAYCLTPIQRDDVHEAPDRLPVDGVVPFTVDRKQADELIGKWINSRWFAPSEFKSYGKSGSFASIYGSYFTYDAETTTYYRGERGDDYTVEVGSGDDKRTETRTRWSNREGTVYNSFDDVTVLANTGFENKRVDKLEPWPTATAKTYSAEYVAGHLCRTYDRGVEECLDDATKVMTSAIRGAVNSDIGGDKQKIHNMQIQWRTMTYKHLLMPIWLLTVMYGGRPFQVYINGVTGEVQGSRPFSRAKIISLIVTIVLVIVAILVVVSIAKGGSSEMVWLIAVLVVGAGIGFATALALNSKKAQRDALDIVPGVASSAPRAWAGAHSPEAKLHRRIGEAVRAAHAQLAVAGSSMAGRVMSLDEAAVTLDRRLVAADALPSTHRDGAIADIGVMVARFEQAIADLATDGVATAELDAAFDRAIGDIGAELIALAQARAEVENIDRGTIPPT